jgi:hypothetical protein
VQHLEAAYLNRIKSLVIDVSDRMTNGIENDAEFIADCLRPLCRNGRLQNIKVQTRGWLIHELGESPNRWCTRPDEIMEVLRSKLDLNTVGKDVLIEANWIYDPEAQKSYLYRSIAARDFSRG